MNAAPSSCRVSTKWISLRPYISVTMLLVVVPTTPKVYSTPSARRASITACPAFICAMSYLAGGIQRSLQDDAPEGIIHTANLYDCLSPARTQEAHASQSLLAL